MRIKFEWLMTGIALRLAKRYMRTLQRLGRIEAATYYVKTIAAARQAFIGLVGIALLVGLILAGFLLIHIGAYLWLPWEAETKAVALLLCGAVYFAVGVGILLFASSEKAWMKGSRASEVVEQAIHHRS